MISIRNLSVRADGQLILCGISVLVDSGYWTSLIGPNGAGKTTLLRAIAGLVPFSGEVSIAGYEQHKLRRRELAKNLAYVPQKPTFPEGMMVQDYVLLGRTPHIRYLGTETARDLSVVAEVLDQVALDRHARRRLDCLSGGELQRAALARALAQEPRIILLDEPTTGLDVGHQHQILELIDSLRVQEGLTVLCAIHDLTLAAQFSDQLLLLDAGMAFACGPPQAVLTEECLLQHYGVQVKVRYDSEGAVVIAPQRSGGRSTNGRPLQQLEGQPRGHATDIEP